MDGRSILLAMLPVGITLINYAIIRDLIWGILLGSKSKKTALKIKAEQNGMTKFRQTYIGQHLKKYEKEYKKWMLLKVCTFLFSIAQIIAFAVMIIMKVQFGIIAIICGVIILLDIVLFILMMKETATSTNKKSTKGSPWRFEQ